MNVDYVTAAGVTWTRHVQSVADCDRELGAAVELRAWCLSGPVSRHPGAARQVANYGGLIDALLTARLALAEAEVLDGVDRWGQLPEWGVAS